MSRDTIELFLSSELAISPSGIVERACSREKGGEGDPIERVCEHRDGDYALINAATRFPN